MDVPATLTGLVELEKKFWTLFEALQDKISDRFDYVHSIAIKNEIANLNNRLSNKNLKSTILKIIEKLNVLESTIKTQSEVNAELEERVRQYEYEKEDSEARYESLKIKIDELEKTLSNLYCIVDLEERVGKIEQISNVVNSEESFEKIEQVSNYNE